MKLPLLDNKVFNSVISFFIVFILEFAHPVNTARASTPTSERANNFLVT